MKLWLALAFVVASAFVTPLIQAQSAAVPDTQAEQNTYTVKGKKALYPDEISDDGERTYIFWSSERELPAVFAIDDQKQEILVDGYMRRDYYTIDRVYGQLVFRLGKDVATATRVIGVLENDGSIAPLKHEDTAPQDIRPQVAVRESRLPIWLASIGMAVLALLLFNALEARRQRAIAPTFTQSTADHSNIPAPLPELYVPDGLPLDYELRPQPRRLLPPYQVTRAPRVVNPSPTPNAAPFIPQYSPPPASNQSDVTLPYAEGPPESSTSSVTAKGPMIGRLANPSTTIPQGALIGAVLETALDSTRPGQARALVTRDVRGFDGTRVLIPRGSRLIGEYKADLAPGQNRAQVQWTRIIRPDGVTITLDSPAADPLGRAGIRGEVNSHFFERLGGALLSSSIDFGLGAAARSIGGSPVIIALPGGGGGGGAATAPLTESMQIRPTLKVQHGARVTVFVARDLDFSSVDY